LVFSTGSGKPISPNNVLRRHVFPACDALGLKRVTWLTLRRTYERPANQDLRPVPTKNAVLLENIDVAGFRG
jgi:hypothetical protein